MNKIKLQDINSVPKIIKNYLNQTQDLNEFYGLFPDLENILITAKQKIKNYSHREILFKELEKQLNTFDLSEKQKNNLTKLSSKNTVTITTGHQLNLFTGSVFFHYKILQTIKLCEELNKIQKEIYFVPIFWLASEDHDFEEINHFYYDQKKYEWKGENSISVGRKNLEGLKPILNEFIQNIKKLPNSDFLINLMENSYFKSENLIEASQKLVHELFKEYGLLFIDGDSKNLKNLMIPYFKDELENQTSFKKITESCNKLKENYKIQVNPREINLFYQHKKARSRIIFDEKNQNYSILINNKIEQTFSKDDILMDLEKNPDNFSPNALLRPFYQETILPNIVYIGGNAEIAYWLELKKFFDEKNIDFPILIPRNSLLLLTENQIIKLNKLELNILDLLNNKQKSINDLINKKSVINIDFNKNTELIKKMYQKMIHESEKTDKTLKNLLLAQQQRQLKSFESTKKRILKAEKRRQIQLISQVEKLYSEIFPNEKWQERTFNFSEIYLINNQFHQKIFEEISIKEVIFKIINI